MQNNLLTCLFGFHNYSKKLTRDKYDYKIYLCTICKRYGYYAHNDGYAYYHEYDNKGNFIHYNDNRGHGNWYTYDEKGNLIYCKTSTGYEQWLYNREWVRVKPENWEYEKYVK